MVPLSTTPAERVRAYLQARAQEPPEPGDLFRAQGLIARQGEHYLTEQDLQALLPDPGAALRSPALEVHDTWYSARSQADNSLWVETRDPEEFREQCNGVPDLVLRKHTVYRYGTAEILRSLP